MHANKFRWTKAHILASFTLVEAPHLDGIRVLQNIMIMTTYTLINVYVGLPVAT